MTATPASHDAHHIPSAHDTAALVHDVHLCPGCDRVLGIHELSVLFAQPVSTLYKRSRLSGARCHRGYPMFPRRLQDRATVAVRCRDAKTYLEEVAA